MPKTVILGAARTPFGKMGGALASLDATDLGGTAIAAALERAEVAPEQVEHVVFGQVLQAGPGPDPVPPGADQGRHPEGGLLGDRQQGLRLRASARPGWSTRRSAPATSTSAVAGGMESMSNAPYLLKQARFGFRMGDAKALDAMVHDGLTNPFTRQAHGRGGRRGRRRARDHPRRHGQVRAALPRAGDPGHRRGPPARGDRAGHDQLEEGRHRRSRSTRRRGARRSLESLVEAARARSTRTARTPPATPRA